jgi:hypothetical protein
LLGSTLVRYTGIHAKYRLVSHEPIWAEAPHATEAGAAGACSSLRVICSVMPRAISRSPIMMRFAPNFVRCSTSSSECARATSRDRRLSFRHLYRPSAASSGSVRPTTTLSADGSSSQPIGWPEFLLRPLRAWPRHRDSFPSVHEPEATHEIWSPGKDWLRHYGELCDSVLPHPPHRSGTFPRSPNPGPTRRLSKWNFSSSTS